MFCLDAASRGHLQHKHSLDTHSWGTKTKQHCLLYEYRVSYVLGLLTAQGKTHRHSKHYLFYQLAVLFQQSQPGDNSSECNSEIVRQT